MFAFVWIGCAYAQHVFGAELHIPVSEAEIACAKGQATHERHQNSGIPGLNIADCQSRAILGTPLNRRSGSSFFVRHNFLTNRRCNPLIVARLRAATWCGYDQSSIDVRIAIVETARYGGPVVAVLRLEHGTRRFDYSGCWAIVTALTMGWPKSAARLLTIDRIAHA